MNTEQIIELLSRLPDHSYRKYLADTPVKLTDEMSYALGTPARKLVRVLRTVIEAIAAKLFVKSLTLSDVDADGAVKEWLNASNWEQLERVLWKATVRDGTTYALVGYDDAPVIHQLDMYDGRTGALLVYGATNREYAEYGINTWYAADNQRYLDVYYANRIEKYLYDGREWLKRKDTPDETWPIAWVDDQGLPLGVPLIEFTIGESDLANGAVQIQSDLNEALLDQLAVSRTQGFPQRYLKGAGSLQYVTNSYGQPLYNTAGMPIVRTIKLVPGSVMPLGANEELGQLDQADTDTALIDKLLHVLSLITTVPTFYFTGDFPSGVALIQAETRLNGKAEEHQGHLTQGLVELVRTMLLLSNVFGSTAYDTETLIDVVWEPPQIETEDLRLDRLTKTAQAVTLLMGAGALSTEQAVALLHPEWTPEQQQQEVNRISAQQQTIAL